MNAFFKRYAPVYLKGLAMGAADVVPGVSGGTVAFVTGIYDDFLASLQSIRPATLGLLLRRGPKAAWAAINGNFLFSVLAGIATSLFAFANLISYLMQTFPLLVWSLFFGLIFASSVHMLRQLDAWGWRQGLAFALGLAFAYAVSLGRPGEFPPHDWMLFFAGALAICAMILPGISGSFVLLLIGAYPYFLQAIKTVDFSMLGYFFGGCVVGLLLFSHLLGWLLAHFRSLTLAVLTGFLFGSLTVIWPWKQVVTTRINSHGEEVPYIQENLLPWQYERVTGLDDQLLSCALLMLLGLALVYGLEKLADYMARKFQDAEQA